MEPPDCQGADFNHKENGCENSLGRLFVLNAHNRSLDMPFRDVA